MRGFVIDASVGVKWCLPPEATPFGHEAMEVLQGFQRGEFQLYVPGLFYAEVGNALWKLVRFSGYRRDEAGEALDRIVQMDLRSTRTQELVADAFALATAYQRSVYDCVYVALALSLSSTVLTCDEKLVNAMGARFPVRYLGAGDIM